MKKIYLLIIILVTAYQSSAQFASLDFDGTNDYIGFNAPTGFPTGASSYTLEAWIKPDAMGTRGIIGWGTYGTGNAVNALRLTDNGIMNYWWGNDMQVTTGSLVGAWHHVAITCSATQRKIYLDGVLVGTSTITGTHIVPAPANLTIGSTNGGEYFDGKIDNVRVWKTERTQAQIQAGMASNPPLPYDATLCASYNFNAVSGDYLRDSVSLLSNSGTLVNFALTGATSNWTLPADTKVIVNDTAGYATLGAAFTAINTGVHTGNINIVIIGNTTEPYSLELNASGSGSASYTDISITATGSCTITCLTDNGITLYGADNVLINGGGVGNALTFQMTNREFTITNDSQNVTIRNCNFMANASPETVIYINNSGNISLLTNYIGGNGSGKTKCGIYLRAVSNSVISGNRVFDFYHSTLPSTGITVAENISNTAISANRIYQSGSITSSANQYGIYLSSPYANMAQPGLEIRNNIIGYSSQDGTGMYTISAPKFSGIYISQHRSSAAVTIQDNAISGIAWTPPNGTGGTLKGIEVVECSAIITGNTIGSIVANGAITITSPASGVHSFTGISKTQAAGATISGNSIGGISAAGASRVNLYGITASGDAMYFAEVTCTGNTIGGTLANSIANTAPGTDGEIIGISLSMGGGAGSNTVRNLTGNGNSVIGIHADQGFHADANYISGNSVYSLSNTNTTDATKVRGIEKRYTLTDTPALNITGNQVHSLSSSSNNTDARIDGISLYGRSFAVHNNMVAVGNGVAKSILVTGIHGEYSSNTFASYFKNNSIYVGGTQLTGSSATCALKISNTTTAKDRFINNILVNNRSNSGAAAVHRSLEINYSNGYGDQPETKSNIYFGNGSGYVLGAVNSNATTTLTALNNVTDDTAPSYLADPQFTAPAATVPNLHINSSVISIAEGNGSDPGLEMDIDNQARSGLTPHDIGADAGDFSGIAAPSITSLSTASACAGSSVVVTGTNLSQVTAAYIGATQVTISNLTATSATLATGNAALSGNISLINPVGTATSTETFNVYNVQVTAQPQASVICSGGNTAFSVTATGATAYQWRRNGVNIVNSAPYSGATTATLTITNSSYTAGGLYDCVLSAGACNITSTTAVLTVNVSPLPVIQAGNTVLCNGGSTTLSAAHNSPALQFGGADSSITFPAQISGDFTVEFWIRTTSSGAGATQWYNGMGLVDGELSGIAADFGISLMGGKVAFGMGGLGGGGDKTIFSATSVNTGSWIHVAATRAQATGVCKLYINGVEEVNMTANTFYLESHTIFLGQVSGSFLTFNGSLDDIRLWTVARSQAQIRSGMLGSMPANVPGLVNNLMLDAATGTTAYDTATNSAYNFNGNISWTTRSNLSPYGTYSWSNGATTPEITTNAAGNYTVTVTDANGCSATSAAKAVTQTVVAIAVTPASPNICIGGSGTSLTATGAETYTWSPATGLSATTGAVITANPAATTTYTVTGTMANGCSNTKTVTVTVNTPSPLSISGASTICQGNSTTLIASGASTYTWSPSTGLSTTIGATVMASPTATTTYTVTGTNNSGCTSTQTVTVTVNPLPAFTIGGATAICSGSSTTLTALGNYTYAWSPSTGLSATTGSTVTANPLTTTTYTVTGTAANGCTSTQTVTVTVNTGSALNISGTTSICQGIGTTLIASGAQTYAWSPATGLSTATGATVTASPSVTTTYTVTGTNASGCTSTQQVTVTVNIPAPVSVNGTTAICSGGSTSLTASGSQTYTWSPATGLSATTGAAVTASPSATTTYTITGTDANGCTATKQVTVTVNTPATVVINGTTAICSGASTTLTASGSQTYTWSPATGLSATTGAAVTASPSATTTYTVTGTDANGCTATKQVTVTVNIPAPVSINGTTAICSGASTTLTASGSQTYTWSPATGLSATTGAAVIASPSATTTYTVTGTDANGCTATKQVTVTVNIPAPVSINGTTAICSGASTTLTASGSLTYAWSPATGLSATTGAVVTASPLATTIYTVTGTDANGCNVVKTVTVTVDQPQAPVINASATGFCPGGATVLSASNTSSPALGLSNGTYFGFPRTISDDFTIEFWIKTTNPGPDTPYWHEGQGIIAGEVNGVANDFGISLANGKIAFGIGNGASGQDLTSFSVASVNTGQWVHVAVARTKSTGAFAIYINGLLDSQGVSSNTNSLSASSSLWIGRVQGSDTYLNASLDNIRLWNTVRTQQDIFNNMHNGYTTAPQNLFNHYNFNAGSGNFATDTGYTPAAIAAITSPNWVSRPELNASSVLWSNGATTPQIAVTESGNYTVAVTNASGCTATSQPFGVTPFAALEITLSNDLGICPGGQTTLTASGAQTYTWTPLTGLSANTGATVTASPSATTTYTVTGTDANGCTDTAQVTVTVNTPLITINGDTAICPGSDTVLTAIGSDNYTWSPATGLNTTTGATVTASPSDTTTYTVTGTDANGCTTTTSVTVTMPMVADPVIIASATGFCPGGSAVLSATNISSPALALSNGTAFYTPRTISDDFTIEFWIKTTDPGPSTSEWYLGQGIVDGEVSGITNDFGISLAGGKIAFGIGGGNFGPDVTTLSATTVNTGDWVHVAVTRTKATGGVAIYINGLPDSQGASLNTASLTASPNLQVGRVQTSMTNLNASLDDIRIWNVARSQQDIFNSIHTVYSPAPQSLRNQFNFNQNSGSPAVDTGAAPSSFNIWLPVWVTRNVLNASAVLWSNGAATPKITVTEAGTYTATITNSNGCSAVSQPLQIAAFAPVPLSISPSGNTVCAGTDTVLTASGAISYTWSPATGLNTATGAAVTANPAVTTVYTVTGTSADGCTNTEEVTVHVPNISIEGTLAVCNGEAAVLTATGGTSYSWSPATGLDTTTGATVSATPSEDTTYTVTATTVNGCTATHSVLVNVSGEVVPVQINASGPLSFCSGGEVVLSAPEEGLYAGYLWSNGATTSSIIVTESGTFSLQVENEFGCLSVPSEPITVNAPEHNLQVAFEEITICPGESVELSASGCANYSWQGSGLITSSGETVIAIPPYSGYYVVTGTTNGCTSQKYIVVNVTQGIDLYPFSAALVCAGDSVELSAYGPESMIWSPATGLNTTSGGTVTASPEETTTYTITGINEAGCFVSKSVTVSVFAPITPVVEASGPVSLCEGGLVTLSVPDFASSPAGSFTTQSYSFIPQTAEDDFTIEYWMKTVVPGNSGTQWMDGASIVNGRFGAQVNINDYGTSVLGHKLAFGIGNPDKTIVSQSDVTTGQWVHVAVTRNKVSGVFELYINGALEASYTGENHNSLNGSGWAWLGISYTEVGTFFNGQLDELRIWDTVRTPSQIQEGMAATYPALTPGLVSLYSFDEGTGTQFTDSVTGAVNEIYNSSGSSWPARPVTGDFSNVLWSTGATTGQITVSEPGTYTVTVTTAQGCTATSEPIVVTVSAGGTAPATISGAQDICHGAEPQDITVTDYSGNIVKWQRSTSEDFTIATDISYTGDTLPGSTIGIITEATYFRAVTDNACSPNSEHTVITVGAYTTWDGTSWSNGEPTGSMGAVIAGPYSSDGDLYACALIITDNAVVTIADGHNLYIKGKVTVLSGMLAIAHNANLIQEDDVDNTGEITVVKESAPMYRLDYAMWASPVDGQKLKAFSPQTLDNRFYTYNPLSDAYAPVQSPATTDFAEGKGYLIRVDNTHPAYVEGEDGTPWEGTFNGVPNNGNVDVAVIPNSAPTEEDANGVKGFNAIGNPYPSSINIKAFFDENVNNLANDTPIYFWRKKNEAGTSSYCSLTLAGYNQNSGNDWGDSSNGVFDDPNDSENWVINPGQGFIVRATGSTVAFRNDMRVAVNNGQMFRSAQDASDKSRLWLNLTNADGAFGQATIAYTPNTTLGLDFGWDGKAMTDGEVAIYSLAAEAKLGIQARPAFAPSDEVPMELKITVAGNYNISLDHFDGLFAEGQEIYLRDNLLGGTTHNLSESGYEFTADTGITTGRFDVVYAEALGTDIPKFDANSIIVYKQGNAINISTGNVDMKAVSVYDVRGRLLYSSGNINAAETSITTLQAQEQMLIVQVKTVEGNKANKKIIF